MFKRNWACYSQKTGMCITYYFKYKAVDRAARMEDISGNVWNVVKVSNRRRHYNSYGDHLDPMPSAMVLSVDKEWRLRRS